MRNTKQTRQSTNAGPVLLVALALMLSGVLSSSSSQASPKSAPRGSSEISVSAAAADRGSDGTLRRTVRWRGKWRRTANYRAGDFVRFRGKVYFAKRGNKAAKPPKDGSKWIVLDGTGGATGPAGADGVTGPAGADGVTGPAGADGTDATVPDTLSALAPLIGGNSENISSGVANEFCYLGEIKLTAASFALGTHARGQMLDIVSNQALFSLLGTTYGGDGRTTFALPDMRALEPNNMRYSICTQGLFPSRN